MSKKSQQKNARRQKRLEKKRHEKVKHDKKLLAKTCPNCGEIFGVAGDPDVVHRGGPCDCTPEIRKAMDDFLDAREEAFENAKGGKIPCVTCGAMHGEAEQSTHFFEGRLVWDGCDACVEAQSEKFEQMREEHRLRWFGPRPQIVVDKTLSKYVPPPVALPAQGGVRVSLVT